MGADTPCKAHTHYLPCYLCPLLLCRTHLYIYLLFNLIWAFRPWCEREWSQFQNEKMCWVNFKAKDFLIRIYAKLTLKHEMLTDLQFKNWEKISQYISTSKFTLNKPNNSSTLQTSKINKNIHSLDTLSVYNLFIYWNQWKSTFTFNIDVATLKLYCEVGWAYGTLFRKVTKPRSSVCI